MDIGWYTPKIRRFIRMIRYWNRLLSMENDRLTKKIFLWDYSNNYRNWCAEIGQLLNSIGLDSAFDNLDPCVLSMCENKLQTLMEHMWTDELDTKPKLKYYKMFKELGVQELYVNDFLPRYERCMLAKLRFSILPLNIEVGRYLKVFDPILKLDRPLKPEERVCNICKCNDVEDEVHFICLCPTYQLYRRDLYRIVEEVYGNFKDLNPVDKYIFLMKYFQRETANFIIGAWKLRASRLLNN
jgi:hypothetical protein